MSRDPNDYKNVYIAVRRDSPLRRFVIVNGCFLLIECIVGYKIFTQRRKDLVVYYKSFVESKGGGKKLKINLSSLVIVSGDKDC
jgi:hypothetical protein